MAQPRGTQSEQYRKKYLQSRQWKRRRWQLISELHPWCRGCGWSGRLDAHHLHYDSLYREQARDVVVLCRLCHRVAHKFWDSGRYKTRESATWAAVARCKSKPPHRGVLAWLLAW